MFAMRLSKFDCLYAYDDTKSIFRDSQVNFLNDEENFETVCLFGREYPFPTALFTDTDVLFSYCRKYFLRLNEETKKRQANVRTDNSNRKIRTAISNFLNYILRYLQRSNISDEDYRILVTHLKSLRILFHKLSLAKLPDQMLFYYASGFRTDAFSSFFHLVHCHLDFRWLFLNIIQILNEKKRNLNIIDVPNDPKLFSFCMDEEILRLMNELMWISMVRFENTDPTDLAQNSVFSCTCFKQLWFLLIHYQHKNQEFWDYFRQTLKIVLDKKIPPSNVAPASSQMIAIDYLPCKDRNVFALWFLSDVIQLFEYDASGTIIGKPFIKMDNIEIVDEIIQGVFAEGNEPSEPTLRNLLPLIYKIQTVCEHKPSRPISYLWEFFFKKIHSLFYMPGTKFQNEISKTGLELFELVKTRVNSSKLDNRENSFLMFVHLLGDHVKANGNDASNRLLSRIFLKFSVARPEKLSEFREKSVFHLTNLFLTLAMASQNGTVVKRLIEILAAIPVPDNLNDGTHGIIWKSYTAALITIHFLNSSIADSVDVILKHLDKCLQERQLRVLEHFTSGLEALAKDDHSDTNGYLRIIDNWIPKYANVCDLGDKARMFTALAGIIQKMKLHGDQDPNFWQKMDQFVMPCLLGSRVGADLAAVCVLTCSAGKIIKDWSNRDDCMVSGLFLCAVFNKMPSPELVQNLQSALQTVFVRCIFLWGSNDLTKQLGKYYATYCTPVLFNSYMDDPFLEFVNTFGTSDKNPLDFNILISLRKNMQALFPNFDQWLRGQFKTLESLPEDICRNIYRNTSLFLVKCPYSVYTKSDPHCFLKTFMDVLILPTPMFRKDYSPPPRVLHGISQHLEQIIEGLIFLGPDRDPYIARLIRDILITYIPRYSTVPHQTNPFRTIIFKRHVMEAYLPFLTSPNDHPNATLVSSSLGKLVPYSTPHTKSMFSENAPTVLDILILLNDIHPVKQHYLAYFLAGMLAYKKSIPCLFNDALKKHSPTGIGAWLDIVKKTARYYRKELAPLPALITQTIMSGVRLGIGDIEVSLMFSTLKAVLGNHSL